MIELVVWFLAGCLISVLIEHLVKYFKPSGVIVVDERDPEKESYQFVCNISLEKLKTSQLVTFKIKNVK